jgi:hypothetical protein
MNFANQMRPTCVEQFANFPAMKTLQWPVWSALLLALAAPAAAQDAPDNDLLPETGPRDGATEIPNPVVPGEIAPNGVAPAASSRVYVAEAEALAQLPAVLARAGGPGAVSLRASEAEFEDNAPARVALLRYVQNGGTVFLHTGAARAFGFTTIEARTGTNRAAGQLFGRARAALPFGAHPLLWDDGTTITRRTPNTDQTQLPGVNLVFYEAREGDHLVVGHPAGTPLLQISDLASNLNGPLYAAAIAPFGRGFAVFAPDFVDQKRADGALFARNLLRLLSPANRASRKWVAIPANLVENGANSPTALTSALDEAAKAAGPVAAPALPAFGTTAAVPVAPTVTAPLGEVQNDAVNDGNITEDAVAGVSRLFLGTDEARSYVTALRAGGDQASVAINVLRARLFLSRADGESASRALDAATDFAPENSADASEIALWRGVLLAGAAQNINQSSIRRAQLLADAARSFSLAQTRRAIQNNPAAPASSNAASAISATTLRQWSVKLAGISQVFALEPPVAQQFGVGDAAITLRSFANDASAELVILSVQALADARNFGWRGDREEILLFPNAQTFARYRGALGLEQPTVPLPAGAAGDVLGQRLILVALPSIPLAQNNPQTGETTAFAIGNNTASVLARLHSYVLLNALDEGGSRVPVWLQLGLENLVNLALLGQIETAPDNRPLEQFAQVGALLTPAQFGSIPTDPVRYRVAQLQASAITTYFYREFGAGAVVETLQRLGAGQTIDAALEATTEGTQDDLFLNWRNAQFGPRQFPNRG